MNNTTKSSRAVDLMTLVLRWRAYWSKAQESYRRAERAVCLCKTSPRCTLIIIRDNRQFSKHAREHQRRMKRIRRAVGLGLGEWQIEQMMNPQNAAVQPANPPL